MLYILHLFLISCLSKFEGVDVAVATDKKSQSVLIHLRSVGEAPAFRNNKFRVSGEKRYLRKWAKLNFQSIFVIKYFNLHRILDIEKFVYKKLGESTTITTSSEVRSSDMPSTHHSASTTPNVSSSAITRSLYLYCGSGFSPTGDQILQV